MCGIVGYIGPEQAAAIIVEGLRRLEYRGYDSAGLALLEGGVLQTLRTVGKLSALDEALRTRSLPGRVGIGHTRWATHGRPNEANAHPHVVGGVAVVHNGIVENFAALRRELLTEGAELRSETDTEVIAHLVQRAFEGGAVTLIEATRQALRRVRGTYALAIVAEQEPGTIVVARWGSPLVVGRSRDATLCGSDVPALLSHTREMTFLEDGDLAELKPGRIRVETLAGEEVQRAPRHIQWSPTMAERGGFKHFMLKEIYEQPDAVAATLRGRSEGGEVRCAEIGVDARTATSLRRICIIACGTSYHAGLVGRYWLEDLAGVPTVVEYASEIAGRTPLFAPGDLVIAVSQSGETYDTIAAVRAARAQGASVLAVCNVVGSQIPRLADGTLYTRAGPEIGVASTKCFTVQLAALLMLAVYLGRARGVLSAERAGATLQALRQVPAQMNELLAGAEGMEELARTLTGARDVLFLGRGYAFPIALEGALKLKEISYAHAEGYAAGEMKHGPIALIEHDLPVVVIAPAGAAHDKTLGNMQEVRARDGRVIAVATRGDEAVAELAHDVVWLPEADELVVPLLSVVPLQLLAYYVATRRGHDVDQPRNLAKTVTVE